MHVARTPHPHSMSALEILHFLYTTLLAGVLGAGAMEFVMWLVSRAGWAKTNMIVALGSLLTGSRTNAWRVGVIMHSVSTCVFAILYTLALVAMEMTDLPAAFVIGLGIGFVHGMLVSLMLVWIVAENHPLEEFSRASFAVGLAHLAGHVAFGGAVGLAVGFLPL